MGRRWFSTTEPVGHLPRPACPVGRLPRRLRPLPMTICSVLRGHHTRLCSLPLIRYSYPKLPIYLLQITDILTPTFRCTPFRLRAYNNCGHGNARNGGQEHNTMSSGVPARANNESGKTKRSL